MAIELKDLTNSNTVELVKVEDDGISQSICTDKTFNDVLYIPQRRTWYLISCDLAKQLTSDAADLDNQVKEFTLGLYENNLDKKQINSLQNAALQAINAKGILENYKTRSSVFFLEDINDKKTYAQLVYMYEFMKTYFKVFESTEKRPTIEDVKELYDRDLELYANKLGLSAADITEGAEARKGIDELQHYVAQANRVPRQSRFTRERLPYYKRQMLDLFLEKIEIFEEKSKKSAKENGYTWYKSSITGKYRFVKNDEVDIENVYNSYLQILTKFLNIYEKSPDEAKLYLDLYEDQSVNVETDFKYFLFRMIELGLGNNAPVLTIPENKKLHEVSYISGNLYDYFYKLNKLGLVLPEQVLTKEQIFGSDKNQVEKYNEILTEYNDNTRKKIFSWGAQITNKTSLNSIVFDHAKGKSFKEFITSLPSAQKPLYENSHIDNKTLNNQLLDECTSLIDAMGFYQLQNLYSFWQAKLANYIQGFVEGIMGNNATVEGFASEGFYFLKAIEYQISYLKYQGECNLKSENLKFCVTNNDYIKNASFISINSVLWKADDINLHEYNFAWKETDTHVVEYFLASEQNRPRYMLSPRLTDIDNLLKSHKIKKLQVKESADLLEVDLDPTKLTATEVNNLKNNLLKGIGTAVKQAIKNKKGEIDLNASGIPDESTEKFVNYTSAIQGTYQWAGGDNLDYTVTAHAELLRFSADRFRFDTTYPESLADLKDAISQKQAQLISLDSEGSVDLLAGYIKSRKMLPDRKGLSMIIPSVNNDSKYQYFHLGDLRVDTDMTFQGSVGVGFAMATSLEINSVDSGLALAPVIPATTNTIGNPAYTGQLDLFAGAKAGIAFGGDVRWCKPKPKDRNTDQYWFDTLNQQQRETLFKDRTPISNLDEDWKVLGSLCARGELSVGVGLRGYFKFGYINKKFVIECEGGLTYGVGGTVCYAVAIYPENLVDIVNTLTDILGREDFHRVPIFTENEKEPDQSGYKLLNTLITMTLVTGVDLANLALLDIRETIKSENALISHTYTDTIAGQVNTFFRDHEDSREQHKAWFSHLPPETRGRLLYSLVNETKYIDSKLMDKIELNSILSDEESDIVNLTLNSEKERVIAVIYLLTYWFNSESKMSNNSEIDRQIEESFARFNPDGHLMMANHYGNKVMPIIVWEKISGFLQRFIDLVSIINTVDPDLIKTMKNVKEMNNRFEKYFYSAKRYREKEFIFSSNYHVNDFWGNELKKDTFEWGINYSVYKGDYRTDESPQSIVISNDNVTIKVSGSKVNVQDMIEFGYYHLARKEIFPEEYEKTSDEFVKFITANKKWREELQKKLKDTADKLKSKVMDEIKEILFKELIIILSKIEKSEKKIEENIESEVKSIFNDALTYLEKVDMANLMGKIK